MKSVLFAEGLWVWFGRRPVLRGINVELTQGTMTVLLGPNGAGKTTFLRVTHGCLRPERGAIRVLGLNPWRARHRIRERVAFVPASPEAPGWMSTRELARFQRAHYPRWNEARLARMLDALDVPENLALKQLSRGQAMKATLALALAPDPEFVLLDEPFSGLDPLAREDFVRLLVAELAEHGGSALVTTHDLDVAARLGDRVLVLHAGRVAADERAEGLLERDPSGCGGMTGRLRALLANSARAEEALVA